MAQCLNSRVTVLAGPSGVGKSSLINHLIPQGQQRVNAVSGKLAKGRHTTRHVELFNLAGPGLIADTPGFNRPDLTCLPAELAGYFPEARRRLAEADCQFGNCLHREEPNCVVRGDWERYDHYLTWLETATEYETQQLHQKTPETHTKVKMRQHGESQEQPKLEARKYRRTSRRTAHQHLHQSHQDGDD